MSTSLPTVSALMAAYNYEQYVERAIQSALDQDYPPELLEVVVIDDGSTDSTADRVRALAERHPGRVRLIQQPNGGYVAATNRALAEGRGEMLALLDADDMWLPGKTRRQVEMLTQRPALGMVFSDMVVVDSEESQIRPSLIWHLTELAAQPVARVLWENVATQSSIMIRRELREHLHPIPDGIPYADWWITLRSAMVGEIDYSREPLALYRIHGSNLTGDVTGPAAVREARKYIAFQLWVMRRFEFPTLTAAETGYVWDGVEEQAKKALTAAGTLFVAPAETEPDGPASADALLSESDAARERGDLDAEAQLALRALAHDPGRVGARERLDDVVRRAAAAAAEPHPLQGASGLVVLAAAEELLADDALLRAWADALAGAPATLAIDATRLDEGEAAAGLQALVDRCGLGDRSDVEMVAVVGERDAAQRHRMVAAAHARYGAGGPDADGLPSYTPATLARLRELAESGR